MSHALIVVALPAPIDPDPETLKGALAAALDPYSEEADPDVRVGDGEWDWWVVGGRYGGALRLRDGVEPYGIPTEAHSMARLFPQADPVPAGHVDTARICDLIPEAWRMPYAFLDCTVPAPGVWHWSERWDNDARNFETKPDADWDREVLGLLQTLDPATMLVAVDIHR